MITRRDFVELAEILTDFRRAIEPGVWAALQDEIAQFCAASNPRFDRPKFDAACHGPDCACPKHCGCIDCRGGWDA